MTASDSFDVERVARELERVIRDVPGIVTLFAAEPALLHASRQLVASGSSPALVLVRQSSEGLSVVASVGVSGDRQAAETARAISAEIADALRGSAVASIHVRVSRVSASGETDSPD